MFCHERVQIFFFAIIVGQTRVMLNPANKSGQMGELPGVNAPFP